MQRNPSLYLHIHCRVINIFISHDLLPSDLVAQSVEQRWSNPKVVGSIPTLVRAFLCPCVGPFPSVGLTLTWYMGWNISTLHHILSLYQFNMAADSTLWILNSRSMAFGFRNFWAELRIPEPKISGYACKTFVDSRLNKQKLPGFRHNLDYLTNQMIWRNFYVICLYVNSLTLFGLCFFARCDFKTTIPTSRHNLIDTIT